MDHYLHALKRKQTENINFLPEVITAHMKLCIVNANILANSRLVRDQICISFQTFILNPGPIERDPHLYVGYGMYVCMYVYTMYLCVNTL